MSNDSSFIFHSHSVSIGRFFGISFAHQCLQPSPPILFIYVVTANTIPFEKHFHGRYSLRTFFDSQLLCCKIFMLKYFHRTSTLRRIFNTKIFPTKISYNENFPIYGIYHSLRIFRATKFSHVNFSWVYKPGVLGSISGNCQPFNFPVCLSQNF